MNEITLGQSYRVRRQWMRFQWLYHLEVRWESRKEKVIREWVASEVKRKPGTQGNSKQKDSFPKGDAGQWNSQHPSWAFLSPALSRIQVNSHLGSPAPVLYLQFKLLCWNPLISLDMLISSANVTRLACDFTCLLIQPTLTIWPPKPRILFNSSREFFRR